MGVVVLQMRCAGRMTFSAIFSSLNSSRKLISLPKVVIAQKISFPFYVLTPLQLNPL